MPTGVVFCHQLDKVSASVVGGVDSLQSASGRGSDVEERRTLPPARSCMPSVSGFHEYLNNRMIRLPDPSPAAPRGSAGGLARGPLGAAPAEERVLRLGVRAPASERKRDETSAGGLRIWARCVDAFAHFEKHCSS